jgi:hypothetical protein
MNDQYVINGEHYLYPTPGGAFYAVSRSTDDPVRLFLQRLLRERESPQLTVELVSRWTGMDTQGALGLIYHLQSGGLVEGLPMALGAPDDKFETMLPALLQQLSDEGKAILAERRGLHMAAVGFTHETTEELAALGAELIAVQDRHSKLLHRNLRSKAEGWGLVNACGYSEIGFWPLYVGRQCFILAISGLPQFNQAAFTSLIWALGVRYGAVGDGT